MNSKGNLPATALQGPQRRGALENNIFTGKRNTAGGGVRGVRVNKKIPLNPCLQPQRHCTGQTPTQLTTLARSERSPWLRPSPAALPAAWSGHSRVVPGPALPTPGPGREDRHTQTETEKDPRRRGSPPREPRGRTGTDIQTPSHMTRSPPPKSCWPSPHSEEPVLGGRAETTTSPFSGQTGHWCGGHSDWGVLGGNAASLAWPRAPFTHIPMTRGPRPTAGNSSPLGRPEGKPLRDSPSPTSPQPRASSFRPAWHCAHKRGPQVGRHGAEQGTQPALAPRWPVTTIPATMGTPPPCRLPNKGPTSTEIPPFDPIWRQAEKKTQRVPKGAPTPQPPVPSRPHQCGGKMSADLTRQLGGRQ